MSVQIPHFDYSQMVRRAVEADGDMMQRVLVYAGMEPRRESVEYFDHSFRGSLHEFCHAGEGSRIAVPEYGDRWAGTRELREYSRTDCCHNFPGLMMLDMENYACEMERRSVEQDVVGFCIGVIGRHGRRFLLVEDLTKGGQLKTTPLGGSRSSECFLHVEGRGTVFVDPPDERFPSEEHLEGYIGWKYFAPEAVINLGNHIHRAGRG